MVQSKGVAKAIQFFESIRFGVRGVDEGQCGVGDLIQADCKPFAKLASIAHLAMLPGGFETRRVREAAGGKSGVGQLPK